MEKSVIGECRAILEGRPSRESWELLCLLLDSVIEDEACVSVLIPYLQEHLSDWPWQIRPAPGHWLRQDFLKGIHHPGLLLAGELQIVGTSLKRLAKWEGTSSIRSIRVGVASVVQSKKLIDAVPQLLSLEALDLQYCNFSLEQFQELFTPGALPQLKELSCRHIEIQSPKKPSQEQLAALEKAVQETIDALSLHFFDCTMISIKWGAKSKHRIDPMLHQQVDKSQFERLSFQASNCSEKHFADIQASIEGGAALRSFQVADLLYGDNDDGWNQDPWRVEQVAKMMPGLSRHPLEELDILCWGHGELMAAMTPWIGEKRLKSLRYDVDREKWPGPAAASFLQALEPSELGIIDLRNVPLGDKSMDLIKVLEQAPCHSLALEFRESYPIEDLAELFHSDCFSSLQTLSLKHPRVYGPRKRLDTIGDIFAKAKHFPRLSSLVLDEFPIIPEQLKVLLHSPVVQRLRSLAFQFCSLSKESLQILSEWSCPSLQRFSLTYESAIDDDALRLLAAPKGWDSLISLDLSNGKYTFAGIHSFLQGMQLPALRQLSFTCDHDEYDKAGMLSDCSSLEQLRKLHLKGIHSTVFEKQVEPIMKRHPRLVIT